ncbi:aminotransferase class I/II-fold pyridoxal phosphate-dependent enzyme [Streptomyces armeniacus]|uniref:Aminotransferase class I/II-fold pyridoxal phosphate-dependent enzyme n=1 Tax=Streptomyces armeniacus TaxID=83291 RepID=A0A345XVJ2_9ACTN|nr:aminotransferase class I/II-fold pyridoxal phosphate-dependent enzyme [Streptomyces armeniacus]AXK35658.1 aminotransferase class I/II-fold pyridoxal phosphate-dependent enzyme [Streptomyces armeniacus]
MSTPGSSARRRTRSSGLAALAPQRRPRWLAVRSLGRQFGCNGWGIGAVTGAPDTLEALFGRLLPQHTYATAVPLQAAMAAWLRDEASAAHLAAQRARYAAARAEAVRRLREELRCPDDAYVAGSCAAYLLLRVPPWYAAAGHPDGDYRRHCLLPAGVLLGEGHMSTPGLAPRDPHGHVRLYLGPGEEAVGGALGRLAARELGWYGPRSGTAPQSRRVSSR